MAEPTPILDGIIYRYIIYNEETHFAYAYAASRPLWLRFSRFLRTLRLRDRVSIRVLITNADVPSKENYSYRETGVYTV